MITKLIPCFVCFNFITAILAMAGGDLVETVYHPASADNFGTGSPLNETFYRPGSYTQGMVVGHPNGLSRKDRGLMRFDLSDFMLNPDNIKKIEVEVTIYRTLGPSPEREMMLEHFPNPVEDLNGRTIMSTEADEIARETISQGQVVKPDNEKSSEVKPIKVDVTELIKKDIAKGNTTVTFRIRDVGADTQKNNTGGPVGFVVVTSGKGAPSIIVSH